MKRKAMKQWVRDSIYGAVLVITAVGNIVYASTLPPGSIKIKSAQASTYLTVVMVLLGILGLCLIARAVTKRPEKECQVLFNRATTVTVAIMAVYLFLLDKLGFVISSFLFVLVLITYYSVEQNPKIVHERRFIKNLLAYALCAVVTTGVCYYLFGTVLTVVLPQFSLF